MEDSSNCDSPCNGQSVGVIPNQMTTELKCDLQPINIDSISCSDSDASSVVSIKEGCGSPMSSWASDPETDISSVTSCHVMPEESLQDVDLEGNYPDLEGENQFVGVENNDDGFSWEMDNRSYEDLLKKFIEKEEELRVSNFKLQLSEQEIVGLKVQAEKSESQINDMHEKLELKEDELYEQKELSDKEIFKLKNRIRESGSQLDDVCGELNLKKGQLDSVHRELKLKNAQLFMMREKLKLDLKNVHLDYESELNLKNGHLDKMREELLLKKHQLDNVREELKQKVKELNEQKELSKEEVFKLKTKLKESENQIENMLEELELKADQLDNVRGELKLKAEELNEQKELSNEEIFKLKTQITESENRLESVREELSLKKEELQKQTDELDIHISEFANKITDLMEQLKAAQKKEKISKNEVANLRKELDSKSSMIHQLQCQIKEAKENRAALECNIEALVLNKEENDINHEEELRKLNQTLLDSQVMFSWEREKMDADIARLSKLRKQLTSKLEEFETRNKELEKKVMLHGAEKSSQNKLHYAEVKLLQNEISCLKKELGERMNDAKAANMESNKVRIEINEANGKIDKLKTEICSRGDQISHMKNHIDELNTSLKELEVHYRTKVNDENKLIMRVEELEKEASKQNVVISEKAAEKPGEKKEAVKQLWNSLEYNWSGYSDIFKR
ncbi:uncharacterized protein LOC131626304 [Vicia villosa]|uniref:uncharacterized protein LOC131626304 n=1 Tax=Vicia villosa TaxID=3911 RepID=UPI00273AD0A1|nr:uncharacterized protein LOC131626304 [Vicia villosa]